jgi:hypothetical protein
LGQKVDKPESLQGRLGNETFWGIRVLKSSHIFLGLSKAPHLARIGHMLRKRFENALNFHVWRIFILCTSLHFLMKAKAEQMG